MPEELRPDRCGIMLSARADTPGEIQVWELDRPFEDSELEAWVQAQPSSINYNFSRVRKFSGATVDEEGQEAGDDS